VATARRARGTVVVGGLINLPFTDSLKRLEIWLEPSLFEHEAHLGVGGGGLWALAIVAVAVGLVVSVRILVYIKTRVDPARVELPVFAHGWYFDEDVAFMGGPGEAGFEASAIRSQRDRRRRQRRRHDHPHGRLLSPPAPIRFRAQLRLVRRVGARCCWRFLDTGVAVMSVALLAQDSTTNFPILPSLIVVPRWARFRRVLSNRRPDLIKLISLLFSLATGAMSVWMLAGFERAQPSPVRFAAHLDQRLGISWSWESTAFRCLVVLTGVLFRWPSTASNPATTTSPTTRGYCC